MYDAYYDQSPLEDYNYLNDFANAPNKSYDKTGECIGQLDELHKNTQSGCFAYDSKYASIDRDNDQIEKAFVDHSGYGGHNYARNSHNLSFSLQDEVEPSGNEPEMLSHMSSNFALIPDNKRFARYPHPPLTKQVDQMAYELPRAHKFAHPTIRSYSPSSYKWPRPTKSFGGYGGGIAPQFLKVFGDVNNAQVGDRIVLDCVLLGVPRPRVNWLFNGANLQFKDVLLEDTADLCRLTITRLMFYHCGAYTIMAENELGRAVTSAIVSSKNVRHFNYV